jgi:hypothetical protein
MEKEIRYDARSVYLGRASVSPEYPYLDGVGKLAASFWLQGYPEREFASS